MQQPMTSGTDLGDERIGSFLVEQGTGIEQKTDQNTRDPAQSYEPLIKEWTRSGRVQTELLHCDPVATFCTRESTKKSGWETAIARWRRVVRDWMVLKVASRPGTGIAEPFYFTDLLSGLPFLGALLAFCAGGRRVGPGIQ
jgi:hypothetical protein